VSIITKSATVPGYGNLLLTLVKCDECGKEAMLDVPPEANGWIDTFMADPEGGQFCGEVCRDAYSAKRPEEKSKR
jgi:hypothetical protein